MTDVNDGLSKFFEARYLSMMKPKEKEKEPEMPKFEVGRFHYWVISKLGITCFVKIMIIRRGLRPGYYTIVCEEDDRGIFSSNRK